MRSDSAIAGSANCASEKFVCMRILLLEHDLYRKPVPTFRDHALGARVHASGSEDSFRVEPLFHPPRERCKGTRLRLKDLDGRTRQNVGAVGGRVAAAGGGG